MGGTTGVVRGIPNSLSTQALFTSLWLQQLQQRDFIFRPCRQVLVKLVVSRLSDYCEAGGLVPRQQWGLHLERSTSDTCADRNNSDERRQSPCILSLAYGLCRLADSV